MFWEGATLYLSEEDVRNIWRHPATGSAILTEPLRREVHSYANGTAGQSLECTDEGLRFGLSFAIAFEKMSTRFLDSEGLMTGATFLLSKTSGKGLFAVVAGVCLNHAAHPH